MSKFNWTHFRKAKGAIKLHVSYDSDSCLPNELFITNGKVDESKTLLDFERKNGDIFVFDRGYTSYKSFRELYLDGVSFVSRVKSNTIIQKHAIRSNDLSESVLEDSWCTFSSEKRKSEYPETIRIIKYKDLKTEKIYRFLTNDSCRSPQEIADIYKERWQIELFFKWIKQNLN